MATKIRIIETAYPIGARKFPVYVFCLAQSHLDARADIVAALLEPDLRIGVYQIVGDEAGILVYVNEEESERYSYIKEVVNIINRTLRADYVIADGADHSCFYVSSYGTWPGATPFRKLMENQAFRLPYMTE
ncbi:MAG: hypothetical protein WBP12_02525 [Candidatus Saccharimonas sp.]